MACGCKGKTSATGGGRVTVETPGGLRITRANLASAQAYVTGHPGSKIIN